MPGEKSVLDALVARAQPVLFDDDGDDAVIGACAVCGAPIHEGDEYDTTDYGNENICADCAGENIVSCAECGDTMLVADQVVENLTSLCPECHSSMVRCDACERLVNPEDTRTDHTGMIVCEQCYEENFFTCEGCGCILPDRYYGANGYCDECAEEEDAGVIHSYSYKPPWNRLRMESQVRNQIYFGVELEADGGAKERCTSELCEIDPHEDRFYLKQDGSLTFAGIETVSHPATLEYHMSEFPWQDVCRVLARNGYDSHDSDHCGLHVHVTRARLSRAEQIKIGIFVYAQKLYMGAIARRRNNHAAKFKPVIEHVKEVLWRGYQEDRYEAVNYLNRETIELRLFRGTLRVETIKATLQFCDAMLGFIRNHGSTYLTKPQAWGDFVEFVAGNKRYRELVKYMVARRVAHRNCLPKPNPNPQAAETSAA